MNYIDRKGKIQDALKVALDNKTVDIPERYEEIVAGKGEEVATTACAIGLFWHPNCVRRALGTTKMFETAGDPTYYGDIFSFLQRGGGRIARNDGRGVLGIIQEYKAS